MPVRAYSVAGQNYVFKVFSLVIRALQKVCGGNGYAALSADLFAIAQK